MNLLISKANRIALNVQKVWKEMLKNVRYAVDHSTQNVSQVIKFARFVVSDKHNEKIKDRQKNQFFTNE